MISSLGIKGFKSIGQLEIQSLSPLTLIGGENNVGKTTVLEAVMFLLGVASPQAFLQQHQWRGMGEIAGDANNFFAPLFHAYRLDQPIRLTARMGSIAHKLEVTYDKSYIFTPQVPIQVSATKSIRTDQHFVFPAVEVKYERNGEIALDAHVFVAPGNPAFDIHQSKMGDMPTGIFFPARAFVSPAEDAERFGRLDVLNQTEGLVQAIREIDPRLKSLSTVSIGGKPMIHGDLALGRKVPINYMGDGVVRLLTTLLGLATAEDGTAMVDEFGSGVHHSIMDRVWRATATFARSSKSQLIGTTHSDEFLRAAIKGLAGSFEDDFTYIHLDRSTGTLKAKIYSYDVLKAALIQGWEVRGWR